MVATTKIKKSIMMEGVTEIHRPGLGPVHRAVISLDMLGELLDEARIRYAPRICVFGVKGERGVRVCLASAAAKNAGFA